jgi:hypothetical protein
MLSLASRNGTEAVPYRCSAVAHLQVLDHCPSAHQNPSAIATIDYCIPNSLRLVQESQSVYIVVISPCNTRVLLE